jgi:hypothetical protein
MPVPSKWPWFIYSEFKRVLDCLYPAPGTLIVITAAGAARHPNCSKHRARRLDRNTSSKCRDSVYVPCASVFWVRSGLRKARSIHAKRYRGPSFVDCDINRMRTSKTVTQKSLRNACAIHYRDGDLETLLATRSKSGLCSFKRRFRCHLLDDIGCVLRHPLAGNGTRDGNN